MAEGKWIRGLTPDTRPDEAAGAVLLTRLAVVEQALTPAVLDSASDIEHVHQLRVATRRAGAALRIFRPLLPKKPFHEIRERLRTIRRAAAEARDWDVFLVHLNEAPALKSKAAEPARTLLTGYAIGQRIAAQTHLATLEPLLADPLFTGVESLARKPRRGEPKTISKMAVAVLGELLAEWNGQIDAKPTDPAALHQLRIAGKRVRYAMEVFAELFTPPFRDVIYPTVEKVQGILGDVQDAAVAEGRLAAILEGVRVSQPAILPRIRPGIAAWTKELRRSAQAEKKAFRAWEKEWKQVQTTYPIDSLLV